MVIVEDFDEPQILGRIAQKLLDAIAQPFNIEHHDIYVTSSIGISVFPDDSDDPEELMKHADVAMYRSKELGRNTYQFLDADLAERRLRQHTLETALRGALKDNALRLYYQPLVRITDRAIVGAEALLRWTDPDHGVVPPQVFIPLAEESGLIHGLSEPRARVEPATRPSGAALVAADPRRGTSLRNPGTSRPPREDPEYVVATGDRWHRREAEAGTSRALRWSEGHAIGQHRRPRTRTGDLPRTGGTDLRAIALKCGSVTTRSPATARVESST